MENHLIVGVLIAITNVVIFATLFIWRHISWNKKIKPQLYVRNMGVKYTQGSVEWEGMDKVVSILNSKLSSKYGEKFAKELLDRTWIEVVGPNGSRTCPTTVVSEVNKIVGSFDTIRKYPWSIKHWIVVVLQRESYKTADDGAIFHEIVKHIVPFKRGQGLNSDHNIPEYIALENDMHFAYKNMKA